MTTNNQNIAIAGASGFVGTAITNYFKSKGYTITPITRQDINGGIKAIANKIENCNIVINLAGSPILQRWDTATKETIYNSRVTTTKLITSSILNLQTAPKLFISASAVGIYNTTDCHDELSSNLANDFLATVCMDWEREAKMVLSNNTTRLAILRFGIILDKSGGSFPKMALPIKLFVGGTVGNGKQWFPCIHLNDVIGGIDHIINSSSESGIYNFVIPQQITNYEFTKALGKAMHRPTFFALPTLALKQLYGQAAEVLTQGQCTVPQKLLNEGYQFKYPNLNSLVEALTK